MGLDSNGDVKGCQSLPSVPEFIAGNVRERPLADIWNDPMSFPHSRQFKVTDLGGGCAPCKYGALCKGGCASSALSRTGHVGDNPMCWQHLAPR
jgi:radical SAM protein with 4Fe4S-binding SPASM domain